MASVESLDLNQKSQKSSKGSENMEGDAGSQKTKAQLKAERRAKQVWILFS